MHRKKKKTVCSDAHASQFVVEFCCPAAREAVFKAIVGLQAHLHINYQAVRGDHEGRRCMKARLCGRQVVLTD